MATMPPAPKPAPSSGNWMKAAPSSIQAHRVTKAGSSLLVTACQVALKRDLAVKANRMVMHCVECEQKEQVPA